MVLILLLVLKLLEVVVSTINGAAKKTQEEIQNGSQAVGENNITSRL
jgi:hypothetical protein